MSQTIEMLREVCFKYDGVIEQPHFEKISFRVNQKIMLTVDSAGDLLCAMLSMSEQDVFCTYDKAIIYPVPNKWGLKGATYVQLNKINKPMLKAIVESAYKQATCVAPKKKKSDS